MFQFPTSPSCTLWIHVQVTELLSLPGFPIRKSVLRRLFAPSHSLSQLVTSFFGSWCQGIHPTLLVAWPLLILQSCFFKTFASCFLSVKDWVSDFFQSVILKTIHSLSMYYPSAMLSMAVLFCLLILSQDLSLFSFQGAIVLSFLQVIWLNLAQCFGSSSWTSPALSSEFPTASANTYSI